MKRLIPVLVIGSLMVVGCAHKKAESQQPVEQNTVELTPPPAPAPAPEPVYTPAPQPGPVVTPAQSSQTPAKTAPAVKAVPAPAKSSAKTSSSSSKTYTVKKGDTLSEIAKANNTTMQKIMAVNPEIKKADKIFVGQKLKMP